MKAVSEQSGTGHPSTGRRFGIAAAVAAAAITLTSCAAGQHAATAIDRPAIAGTGGQIGSISLQNVSIQAPAISGRETGTKFYATGDDAPMSLTISPSRSSSRTRPQQPARSADPFSYSSSTTSAKKSAST